MKSLRWSMIGFPDGPISLAVVRRFFAALVPWVLLLFACLIVFSRLRHPSAVLPLWRPWAEVGVLACGMTAIVLTGGIDLSVGSTIALGSVVLGLLWKQYGWPIELAAAAAVGVGLLAGAFNGTLIQLGIAPLVATLATMATYSGLALALSGGQRIAGLPEGFAWLGQGSAWGFPTQLWLFLLTWVLFAVFILHTRFGRYLYAIGENRTAAELAAVPVKRLEWGLYALSGLLAGIISVFVTARGGAAVPNAGSGLELQVIACVVLGGTRVTGGAGGPGRTLLGLAVLAHLEIGLRLLGASRLPIPGTHLFLTLSAHTRLVIIGLLLIAVAVLNERLGKESVPT
jgi:rhamnose transport system permease protein